MLEDLDERARPDAPSKNRVLQKFTLVSDIVALSSETIATTLATPPYHWHDAAGTTATSLIWGLGQWVP